MPLSTPTTRLYTGDPNSEFCRLAKENSTRVSQVGSAVSNPEQLAALLGEVAPAVREIVKVAPPELKDDMPVLADGFEKLLTSANEGQIDLSILTEPKFQAAGQNLAAYGQQVCGIQSGGWKRPPTAPRQVNGHGVDRLRRAVFCSDKPRPSAGLSVRRPTPPADWRA